MRNFDTITITAKGQAQFPVKWRKLAGLALGGSCDVRPANDGRQSLIITPRVRTRLGAAGLLAHLQRQEVPFPKVERHHLPFK